MTWPNNRSADSVQLAPLRGIVLRQEADTLVVQASDADIQRFAGRSGESVAVERKGRVTASTRAAEAVLAGDAPPFQDWTTINPGEHLYNEYGYPVAVVTELHLHTTPIEVTTFGSQQRQYRSGPRYVDIRAQGIIG